MRPLWHPLSALLLADVPSFASPALIRVLLGRSMTLRYAGDRMWPAVPHGKAVVCRPPAAGDGVTGEVVVACADGIPDLLRIVRVKGSRLLLRADADPSVRAWVDREALLALTDLPRRSPWPRRAARRLRLDLAEAWSHGPDPVADAAATVRDKYNTQAPFYASSSAGGLSEALRGALVGLIPPGLRVLVAGSGSGRECWQLAESGWRVSGVDFSPAMVEHARAEGRRRGFDVSFQVADLREHREPEGSLGAVVFTYDVYSFLPGARSRVDVLRRVGSWLRPGGVALLSARRLRRPYDALLLTLQHAARRRRGERSEWGATHTRWIAPDGRLARSFVQVFSRRALEREIDAAGLRAGRWIGGHRILRRPA